LFTSNFRATCAQPRVDWDLASIVQKKVESLREYIQRFCNKMNIVLEADDKLIMLFFQKGLREPSLIEKLAMKNPRMSEEMFYIANKYTQSKEVTIDSREQKESGHMDQPSSSMGHDKKR
jgi:hypothetical protein